MAIGAYFMFEGTTVDQYEEVCRKLNNGELMTKLSDWPIDGCLSHAAWQDQNGAFSVFDVWESAEAFERFGEQLVPLLQEAGFPQAEPQVVQLHNFVNS